jgi:hypothetical protein
MCRPPRLCLLTISRKKGALVDQLDIPIVRAEKIIQPLSSGSSRPLLLRLEDGRVAHAKFQHNPQSTRSLCYDLLGTRLGHQLGCPVPEVVLLDIPRHAIQHMPYLTKYRWRPGLQFATLYYHQSHPVTKHEIQSLVNLADLPLSALFEAWLFNHDVKFSHILCVSGPAPRFILIDHGFILGGPFRSPASLWRSRKEFPLPKPLTVMALGVPVRFDFTEALDRLVSLPESTIESALAHTPREWGLKSAEQQAILAFLVYRQQKLKHVAEHLQQVWNARKPPDAPWVSKASTPSDPVSSEPPSTLPDATQEDWVQLSHEEWPNLPTMDDAPVPKDEEGTPHGASDPHID